MDDGINKTALLLFAGLLISLAVGAYVIYSNGQESSVRLDSQPDDQGDLVLPPAQEKQEVYIRALSEGSYDKGEVTVKEGIPVRLHFTADPNAGCGQMLVLYGLNVRVISQDGAEEVVEFTPKKAGTYEYSCGMRMWGPGRLVVTG